MELASTVAAVAETAEKVYEGTQEIRKVCNATTEVKNVADSEGKDQLDATIGMASSREMSSTTASQPESAGASSDIRSDKFEPGIPDKSMSDSTPSGTASDNPLKGATVFDEGIPASAASQNPLKDVAVFDEGIPKGDNPIIPTVNTFSHENGMPSRVNETTMKLEAEANLASQDDQSEKIVDCVPEGTNRGLSLEERSLVQERTGWSDTILDAIGSMDEAKVYMDAGLVEGTVNGRAALLQPHLDGDLKVGPNGETNKELMSHGYSPRTADGQAIELHHMGQHPDSPLAELTMQQHRGRGNDAILHEKQKESEIDRIAFNKERSEYWKDRSQNF